MSKLVRLIAVVDDEEAIRRALGRLLRSADLAVETFSSGQEFLISLGDHRPDCLILDLHMPSMTGLEVQARMNEEIIRVPTIIITGHDSPESRDSAIRGGASAFLRKPVDVQTLLNAIERAVESVSTPPRTE